MKLLIIGGSGQLSGRLAQMALTNGHEVWAVTRGTRPLPLGVHALRADRSDAQALHAALASARTRWDAALDCICMNAQHARIDLDVLPAFTRRMVVVSTDSVYHPDHKRVPQNENADAYLTGDSYGAHKRYMEQVFLADVENQWTLLRPGHIFGPGFQLGCFPCHIRQSGLLAHMRSGGAIRLVGGGDMLIHPIYVDDMSQAMLDCVNNARTHRQVYCIGGPEIIPVREYYQCIGRIIGAEARIEAVPLEPYRRDHPEERHYLCHRAYTLDKLAAHGVPLPRTSLAQGLASHIRWLDAKGEEA